MRTTHRSVRLRNHRKVIQLLAFFFTLFTVVTSQTINGAPVATAAVTNICDGTAANDQNNLRVAPTHGKVLYIDSGQGQTLDAAYAGYTVTDLSGAARKNLWVKVDSFTGGKIALANANDANYPIGDVSANASGAAFFLLKALASTTTAQSHMVHVYSGQPGLSTSTELYSCVYSFTKVAETIKAAANKVTKTTPSSTSLTAVGTTMTIAIEGNTGTIGTSAEGSVLWFSPSGRSTWPTQSLRLEGTSIQFYKNSSRNAAATIGIGASKDPYVNKMRVTLAELQGLTNSSASDKSFYYTATYTYRILGAASVSANIVPVAQIASGSQMKHTDVGSITGTGTTSITTTTASVSLAVTKSVGTTSVVSGGNTTFHYTISLANSGSTAISVDQVTDDPDNTLSLVASTSKFNGTAITDPGVSASGVLTFGGPFSVPANTTRTLTYDLYSATCASGTFSYQNSATATVGSTVIGSGATTMSVTTASGSCGSTTVTNTTTTTTLPIEVDTDTANVTGNTTATIYGLVDPNGDTGSTIFFDYGTSPTLAGATRTNVGTTAAQTTPTSVNKALTGLTSGTVYYYRVGAGTVLGSILSFVTTEPVANPSATTGVVSAMTLNATSKIDVTFSGTVDPNQVTNGAKVTFEYATDGSSGSCTSLGSTVLVPSSGFLQDETPADVVLSGAFPTEVNTGSLVKDLTNNTFYCFRIRGWYNASSANWNTATNGSWVSFKALVRSTQTISYTQPSTMTVNNTQSTSATASSNLTVTYQSNTPDICTVASNGTVTAVSAGTCSITASQPGDYIYDPATDVTVFFTVLPPAPVITNTSLASGTIGSAYTDTLIAAQGDGTYQNWTKTAGAFPNGVTLNTTTGVISGTPTEAGTFNVTFTVDSGPQTSATKTLSIEIAKRPQTITFNAPSNAALSDGTKSIAATTNASGLHVTLTSNSLDVCTVAASPTTSPFTINLVGQGTCSLVASQAGNATYLAATNVPQTFLVSGPVRTLTFDPNTSAGTAPTTGDAPSAVTSSTSWVVAGNTAPNPMAKAGYTFAGWTANSDGTGTAYAAGDHINLNADKTIYAKWNLITYTITYLGTDKTSGNTPTNTVGVGGVNLGGAGTLARSNYYLNGWTIGGVDYTLTDSYTLSADVNASPIWAQYTVTYADTGSTSGSAPSSTLGVGTVTLATNSNSLARDHYRLTGWTIGGQHYDLGDTFTLTADETATPEWTQYTITYFSTDSTSGSQPNDLVDYGDVLVDSENTLERTNYYFAGWSIGGQAYSAGDTYNLTADVNAYPIWSQYAVTYLDTNSTSGSAPVDTLGTGTVTLGGGGTLTRTNYYLNGWRIGGIDYALTDNYSLTADVNASPIWAQYTISYTDSAAISGSVPSDTLGYGNTPLSGNTNSLYRGASWAFAGWTIGGVDYNIGDSITLTSDVTAVARWSLGGFGLHYLDTDATSGTAPLDDRGMTSIVVDNKGTLERSNYYFAGWLIDGNVYQPGDTYSISSDQNATPVWAQYTLTYVAPASEGGSIPTPQLGYGSQILDNDSGSLIRSGYYLAGWIINGTPYNLGDAYTITADATAEARWAQYTITYLGTDSDGGSVPDPTLGYGNTPLAGNTNTLTRTSYYLAGWTVNGVNYSLGATVPLTGDATASPRWIRYTIVFFPAGAFTGTVPPAANFAGEYTLPGNVGNLTRTGYKFAGWLIDGTRYNFGDTVVINKNTNVFARWVRCGITYTAVDKTAGSVPAPLTGCVQVTIAKAPPTLQRAGYFFTGWKIDNRTYQPSERFQITTAVTAAAQWGRYTVTYLDAEATSGTVPDPTLGLGNVALASNINNLQRDNYYLDGWILGNIEYHPGDQYNLRGNIYAFANWKQYKITYSAPDADGGSIAADSVSLGYLNIPVASYGTLYRAGYLFGGWSINGQVYQPRDTYSITGNVTATAVWNQCAVTYNDGYSNAGAVPDPTYGCNNQLAGSGTLSRSNFYFAGWVIEGVTYQPGDVAPVSGHRTAYALWKKYTLTFTDVGADSGTAPANIYHYGTTKIARATGTLVKAGYYVSGWRVNGVDYPFGSTINISSDMTAYPIWSQYTITYSSVGNYAGVAPVRTFGFGPTVLASNISVDYYLDSQICPPPDPFSFVPPICTPVRIFIRTDPPLSRPGFVFAGWVIGGVTYQPGDSYSLNGNVTAFARWVRAPR